MARWIFRFYVKNLAPTNGESGERKASQTRGIPTSLVGPCLGAERLAAVVHLVGSRHFLGVVVHTDVVAPEGLLTQLVLGIDLEAAAR